MLWISCFGIMLLVILSGYHFFFPLSKKRPVSIKKYGIIFFVVALNVVFFPFTGGSVSILSLIVCFIILLVDLWFVYGISGDMILQALEKAALSTRTDLEKLNKQYIINKKTTVRFLFLSKKMSLVSFRVSRSFKKELLTKEVFRKFLQNYYI